MMWILLFCTFNADIERILILLLFLRISTLKWNISKGLTKYSDMYIIL